MSRFDSSFYVFMFSIIFLKTYFPERFEMQICGRKHELRHQRRAGCADYYAKFSTTDAWSEEESESKRKN